MRELERDLPATHSATHDAPAVPRRLAVVGAGRAGGAIARAARAAGVEVTLHGRGEPVEIADPAGAAVLLCVPDAAIEACCEALAPELPAGVPVGHTSGATTLAALADAGATGAPLFSVHPLQTIPSADADLSGSPCAIAGSDADALGLARGLALTLGMQPFEVADEHRATYHAAAAIASNFLVALEESAAELLAAAGVPEPREVLAPLVLRSAANWADEGQAALTGPIARGDEATVAAHLKAIAERAPELTPLYEALAERTRSLAEESR